jgi:hypothetical protein
MCEFRDERSADFPDSPGVTKKRSGRGYGSVSSGRPTGDRSVTHFASVAGENNSSVTIDAAPITPTL